MCWTLRNTASRGRSGVPLTFFRMRRCRRSRAALGVFCRRFRIFSTPSQAPPPTRRGVRPVTGYDLPLFAGPLALPGPRRPRRGMGGEGEPSLLLTTLAGLPGLAAHDLARIADALALVRLRRAHAPDVGRHLADQLLVDPLHVD